MRLKKETHAIRLKTVIRDVYDNCENNIGTYLISADVSRVIVHVLAVDHQTPPCHSTETHDKMKQF